MSRILRTMLGTRTSYVILLAAAIAVHGAALGVAWRQTGGVDGFAFRSLDAREFHTLATNLVVHDAFSMDAAAPFRPDTWRTPGYPALLALLMRLGATTTASLVIAHQALSAVNVLLFFGLARTAMSNWRAMVVAMLLLVEPYRVYDSLWLMSTTWFMTVLLLIWLCWTRVFVDRRGGWPAALGLGLLLGGLVLIRPLGVGVVAAVLVGAGWWAARGLRSAGGGAVRTESGLRGSATSVAGATGSIAAASSIENRQSTINNPPRPVARHGAPATCATGSDGGAKANANRELTVGNAPEPVVRLWRTRRSDGGRVRERAMARWMWGAVVVLGCALPVAMWMERNRQAAGRFALSHQGGVVLAYFKAAEVELWRQGRTADRYLETSLDAAVKAGDGAGDRSAHAVWESIDAELRERLNHLPVAQRDSLRWADLAQGNKTTVDSFAISDALREIAVDRLWRAPFATAWVALFRCAEQLAFPLSLSISPPNGVPPSRAKWFVAGLPYTLLTVVVLLRLTRRGFPWRACYFPIACTLALLIMSTPQLDPRFRIPMMPMLLYLSIVPCTVSLRESNEHSG